jgi:hypothetical protein
MVQQTGAKAYEAAEQGLCFHANKGSERESDGWAILRGFLDRVKSDEFGVGHGHPLGLQ